MHSNCKFDLHDVTFLIPVRIDSDERKLNLNAVIKLLSKDFYAQIIVLEAGNKQIVQKSELKCDFSYDYIYDVDTVFYKTKYINRLLRMADTKYAIVWDVDVVALPNMVNKAVQRVRNKEAFLTFPYDGRVYTVSNILSDNFRQTLKYETLTDNSSLMNLMYGYYSRGGAYVVEREEFLKIGGENENFYGWGPEDLERVVRMEILDLKVNFEQGGVLFHLWHPRNENSWFANREIELKNRRAYLYTCQSDKESILQNIKKCKK